MKREVLGRLIFRCLVVALLLAFIPNVASAHEEEFHSSSGELEVVSIDNLVDGKSDRHYYFIPDSTKERLELLFDGQAPANLKSGDRLKINRGRRIGQTVIAPVKGDGGNVEIQSAVSAAITGVRNTIVVFTNMTDRSVPCTQEQVAGYIWNNAESNHSIYQRSSFGAVSYPADSDGDGAPDIASVTLDYAYDGSCNYSKWLSDAKAKLSAQSISTAGYEHRVFMLPAVSGCGWGGIGWINAPDSMINGSSCTWLTVYPHELGHNNGLAHAGITGQAEYTDHSSFMGNPGTSPLANSANAAQQGWLGSRILSASSGSYRLSPLFGTGSLQVIQIAKADTNEFYYVSYRHASGNDIKLGSSYSNLVSIHKYTGSGYSPTTLMARLGVGGTFSDSVNGITIRVDGISAGNNADVSIITDCAAAAPALSISPAVQYSASGSNILEYVLTVTNQDSNCDATTFSVSPAASAELTTTASSSTITLAQGQSGTVTLLANGSSSTPSGSYSVSALVEAAGHPSVSQAATYVVDSLNPNAPSGLSATIAQKTKVKLVWGSATDNGGSGISNYRIFRNGAQIATVSGTSYTDASAPAGVAQTYFVVAVDNVGNVSSQSNSATITIGGGGGGGGKPPRK